MSFKVCKGYSKSRILGRSASAKINITWAGLGADMTPEATLAKLSYILAKEGLTTEERKKLLVTNLRGELTQPDMKRLTLSSSTFLSKVAASLRTEFIEHMCDFTTGNSC